MVIDIGYKQTEIGIIPEDWTLAKLSEYLKSKPKYGIGAAAVPYDDNKLTYLRITDISDDGHFVNKNKASINSLYASEYILIEHDIVVARTGASVGKSYLYNTKDGVLVYAGFLIRLNPNIQVLNSTFLKYILQTNYYWNWVRENSMRSGQPGINSQQLQTLIFAIPNIKEQTAIANALSDMDALIAQTEKIIEKKKAIKQGVMQELLRPKEGWVTKKLGDSGKTYGGITGKTKTDFGKGNCQYIPFMNIMRNPIIDIDFLENVDIRSGEAQNKAYKSDLFFNGSSETPEEVGLCSVLTEEVENLYLNSFCFGYRLNNQKDFNGLFLSYLFRSPLGRNLIFSLAQGATRYNLSKNNLLKLEIPIPSKTEQDHIAMTLLDLDHSIKNSLTKLQKLKLQKQGMMQALLTGKIRLA